MSTISALQNQVVVPSTAPVEDTSEADAIEEQRIEFLEILITQLENQNPLDPMDTDEYTNQLIQYAQLDQQLEMKVGINEMVELMGGQNSIMALNYLGEAVELATNASVVQDGEAVWNYLTKGADKVNVQIIDENGDMIEEIEGETSEGTHQLIFDATSYGFEEDTPLFIKVYAYDDQGEPIDSVGITSHVKVDGLTGDGQDPYMTAGGITFGIADILKVSEDFVPSTTSRISDSSSSEGEGETGGGSESDIGSES